MFFSMLAVLIFTYIIAAVLMAKGQFTITLPREQMVNLGLVLSDTPDFARPRHEILSPPVIDLWNISEGDIPANVDQVDGSHNGPNHLAMTFYLKNIGHSSLEYNMFFELNDISRNVDEALRIKIYEDGVPILYAKEKSDSSGDAESGTMKFSGRTRIIIRPLRRITPQEFHKYTVVAWIEGDDPDCGNDLLGGYVKMTMRFDAKTAKADTDTIV